jgi:hypothetical protein
MERRMQEEFLQSEKYYHDGKRQAAFMKSKTILSIFLFEQSNFRNLKMNMFNKNKI